MSSRRTIHLWGLNDEPSLISPESIAICWVLQSKGCKNVDVVFSNNTDLSPSGELPLLIDESGKKYSGIFSIVEKMFPQDSLLELALLKFVQDEMNRYTEYELYLDAVNYNKYTSKIYSYLLHWPFWYNTPLGKRNRAEELCQDITVDIPDIEDISEENNMMDDASDMAQSKVFRVTQDNKSRQLKKLKQLKNHSRFLSKLDTTLKQWFAARKTCNKQILLPADLLLGAHIKVLTSLPQGDLLRTHLEDRYPEWYLSIKSTIEKHTGSIIPNRPPRFVESGNILMTALNQAKGFI